jgi:predicted alpha/beta-fold hydrolase
MGEIVATDTFVPVVRWRGGHRMTVYTWARPRRFPGLPAPTPRYFDVAADARVLAHCYWQPRRRERPVILALHGLEGSSSAHYMRGLAHKAWVRGWSAVLLNQRNCGGTEHLSAGLYHSGLTNDPRVVIDELLSVDRVNRIAVVGYSLGGNLTMKLAGELGADAPSALRAVCAVSPTMELAVCVDALERRENRLYEWNFVRDLKARMRRKAAAWPGRYDLRPLGRIRTVRQFDDAYTAPYHGFGDASHYYHCAASMRVADRIRVPALLIAAEDDPFVPTAQFEAAPLARNGAVTRVITRHGGHCGFVGDAINGSDGYWAEDRAMAFFAKEFGEVS